MKKEISIIFNHLSDILDYKKDFLIDEKIWLQNSENKDKESTNASILKLKNEIKDLKKSINFILKLKQ